MTAFICEGDVYHNVTIATAEGPGGAAKSFMDLYGDWPQLVNGVVVIGGCDVCKQAVFEGESTHMYDDGVVTHHAAHCCDCELLTTQGGLNPD